MNRIKELEQLKSHPSYQNYYDNVQIQAEIDRIKGQNERR